MAWIGALIGLGLAILFQSFEAAVILAVLGGFAGHAYKHRNDKSSGRAPPEQSAKTDLEIRLEALQEQFNRMSRRVEQLEKNLRSHQPDAADSTGYSLKQVPGLKPGAAETPSIPPTPASMPAIAAAAARSEKTVPEAVERATAPAASPRPVPSTAAPIPAQESPAAAPRQSAPAPRPPRPPAPPSWLRIFINRWIIGGNPIVKIGVLILFLGLAFLLRYAAEHAVLPVEYRYAGVAASGIGLLLFGWRWRLKNDSYGLILQGAGIGVLYLTTLAAMKLHPLIPPQFGFAILIGVAGFAALLAILQNSLALAVIGTLGGFAAPVLTSTGHGNHVALFSYLALLNLGIIAVAWFKAWRVLNLIGFAGSFALGCAWAAKSYRDELFSTTEPFLLLLFVQYVLITFLFARRTLSEAPDNSGATYEQQVRQSVAHVSYVDGTLVFGVPFSTFGLQYLLVQKWHYGPALSALGFGLAYIVLAFMLFHRTGRRYLLLNETLIALGVIFGSLAIPLGLEPGWTSAAWAVEAAGVYWVGIRQQRLHARLFALLLLIGSAIYFALGLHIAERGAVLDGSLLGSALLAASAWWTYRLMRQSPQILSQAENEVRPFIIAFGAFFVAAIPFLLWPMDWAAPALAVLGSVGVFFALRLSERPLLYWGWLYQALAGALFMTTLHSSGSGSVLVNGWSGLLAAGLIGASMLAGVWAIMRERRASTGNAGANPAVPIGGVASVALLTGLAFINLAPLFVLPWNLAVMVWPLTGIATLWWAVRAEHTGAVIFALALQALAGVAYFGSSLLKNGAGAAPDAATPFMHTGFWGPVVLALAALICARLLQRPQQERAPISMEASLGWISIIWAGAWWAFAWVDEITRVSKPEMIVPALAGIAIATAWLTSSIAQRWNWKELGAATLAYLPALAVISLLLTMGSIDHPLASWGALAWPAALLMHGLLLRRQTHWVRPSLLKLAHIAGAWLFIALAAAELRWQFAHWSDAGSAWPLLGWMIAPVAYLWALTSHKIQISWPIRDYPDAYRVTSARPIVLYLLGWAWISNAVSNGSASPLPYVPFLNPLEIAHLAVLLGIASWWRSLPATSTSAGNWPLAAGVLGSTALAWITGIVARTCHHWGGVAWNAEVLLASNLVQTSLSIVWGGVAIGLMLAGNRLKQRWIWIVGALLIAVVVAKLFLVELSATGSLARIISFIVVGLLLLLVGYFAPLPPQHPAAASPSSEPDSA